MNILPGREPSLDETDIGSAPYVTAKQELCIFEAPLAGPSVQRQRGVCRPFAGVIACPGHDGRLF
jgi:hypothetical protein